MEMFISYRRKDSHYIADRIYDGLVLEFGRDSIFKDVDAIPLGRDFRRILQEAVTRCDVLLAVIGPRWLGETDAMGRRRVDDPEDWVRIEIETALERAIPVIPLLVDGASFPRGDDLPPSLQGLVYRHGTSVRPDPDFHHDMGRVIKALREIEPVVSSNQSQVRGREPSRSKNPATESVLPHSRSDRTSYSHLLRWALLFAIIALVAGFFGFYGVQGISAQIAKICFFVFLVLFVVSLIMGRRVVEGPPL